MKGRVGRAYLHNNPPLCLPRANVVQRERTVGADAGEHGGLGEVEAHARDRLCGGGEGQVANRRAPTRKVSSRSAGGTLEQWVGVAEAYLVSSHIWTMFEAVAKSGSDRWWSIELWYRIHQNRGQTNSAGGSELT
jgi:hypothetical protein